MKNCFEELIKNSHDLYLDENVSVMDRAPDCLTFQREYVFNNRPLLIKNGCKHWIANYLWSNDYLCKTMKDKMVTVAVTPNGKADSVFDDKYFIEPEYIKMKFNEFVQYIETIDEHRSDNSNCKTQQQFKFMDAMENKVCQCLIYPCLCAPIISHVYWYIYDSIE